MRLFTKLLLSASLLCIFSLSLHAQEILSLDGHQQRHQITASPGENLVEFTNIIVGETYNITASGELGTGDCIPVLSLEGPDAPEFEWIPEGHQLRFTATDKKVILRIEYPCSFSEDTPPQQMVSIICQTCVKKDLKGYINAIQEQAPLTVAGGISPEALVRDVIVGGNCFDITNVTYSGQGGQIGTFANGLTNIGFDNGGIIATGDVSVALGPNDQDGASGGYGNATPDGDLQAMANGGATFDMANIEFDFTPTQSPLTFEYVFASEEYCEYVNSQFNDAFGFFISGPGIMGPFSGAENIAQVSPGTYVTINNVNHLSNAGFYYNNTGPNGVLCGQNPQFSPTVNEVQYDGYTRKMVAVANVIPCETYHISLKIADVGDGVWDSAVFLKAGSFDGGGNASADFVVNGDPLLDVTYEDCGTVELVFERSGGNINLPVAVTYTVTGTATPGVDYSPIPPIVVIPAGQQSVTLNINIFNDLILEGAETIIITLSSPCSCLNPQEILTINDLPQLDALADTVTVCGSGVGTVSVTPLAGVGPYTYQWNTGSTDPSTTAFVSVSTNFYVTVTDDCGKSVVRTARIEVTPPPNGFLLPPGPQLCPGETGILNINFNGDGPFDFTYLLNGNPNTIQGITDDPYEWEISQAGVYQLTGVVDGDGCPGPGAGVVNVTINDLDMTGVAQNVDCAGGNTGSIDTEVTGGQGPMNYSWSGPVNIGNLPDANNLPAGDYGVTVTDASGCKDTLSFTLTAPDSMETNIEGVTIANCWNPTGGSIDLEVAGGNPAYEYEWNNGLTVQDPSGLNAGMYTVTITDDNNCTAEATAEVPGDFDEPLADAVAPGPVNCVDINISLDGSGSSQGSNFSYEWVANPGNIISGENTLNPIVDMGGNYILTVLDSLNGCTQSDTVAVIEDNTAPDADAGADQTINCFNGTPSLDGSGSSQGPDYEYVWTGGGLVSGDSTLNPVVNAPGNYTILVTNTANGCTQTDNVDVDINLDQPTASAANPPLLNCTLSQVTLDGSASEPSGQIDFEWTTQNGVIDSGGNTANPIVSAAGDYVLIVTDNINGCMDTVSVTVLPDNTIPTVVAAYDDTLTCAVTLTQVDGTGSSNGNNMTPMWTTQDGVIESGHNDLIAVVSAPGTYTLIVTNTDNSCTASYDVTVPEDLLPPVADAGTDLVLSCTNPTLTLDGTGSSTGSLFTYLWSPAGNGNIVSGNTTLNPVVNASGTYNLVVTDTNNGCTSEATVNVLDDATEPMISMVDPATLNCSVTQIGIDASASSTGPSYVYSWNGPGIVNGDSTLNPTVNQPGNYTLLITNTDNGCTTVATANVPQDIAAPPADAGPDDILNCYNPELGVGGAGNPSGSQYTFNWNGPGIISGMNSANAMVDQSGTYSVLVTNTDNGCTSTDDVFIDIDVAPPNIDAGQTFELTCVQNTFTLLATGDQGTNFEYLWSSSNGGGFADSPAQLNPTVNAPGTYEVVATNTTNGCTSTASVDITQSADIPPVEAGTADVLTCAVTSITLNGAGTATGPEFTYLWTPISGNIVSGANGLTPTVDQPGVYLLEVFNTTNNCADTDTVHVTQDILAPDMDAGASVTVNCENPVLNLSGAVNNPGQFSYLWTAANGGNIVSGNTSLTPNIDAAGDYTLLVTDLNNGCTSTDLVTVADDFVDPISAIANPDILTCAIQQITLDASGSSTGNMDYQWSGGNIVDQSNPLAPSVDAPGTYTLLVTDLNNGCTSTISVEVPQDIENPTAEAGANPTLTCAITSLDLDGAGSSQGNEFNYSWDGPGLVSGNTSLSPTINAEGTYTLTVEDQTNGCTSTDVVTVNLDDVAPAVAVANPAELTCAVLNVTLDGTGSSGGPNINFSWTANPGNILSGATSNQALIDMPGSYTLLVTNQTNGCTSTETVNVNQDITAPLAEAGPGFFLTCATNQINLQGDGSSGAGYTYSWSTSNGVIVSGANTLTPLVNQAGLYNLLVTNQVNGCTSTDAVQIDMETNIPVGLDVALEPPSCNDDDGVITFNQVDGGVGPFVYSIDGGSNFFTVDEFEAVTPGTYTLWIQDANGCEYQEPLIVPMAPDPSISITPEIDILLGESAQLNAILPSGYPLALIDTIIWEPMDGLVFPGNSILDLLKPTATPFKSTEYTVRLISGEGCEAEDRIIVRVDTEPHVYIPNAFSPWNQDGENDIVYIFADGYQVVGIRSFKIFDRWGNQVFEDYDFQPNDPKHGWDGYFRGEMMTPAVFVYYAEIEMIDGRIIVFKGDITLVR